MCVFPPLCVLLVDCKDHFKDIQRLRSLSCPVRGCKYSNLHGSSSGSGNGEAEKAYHEKSYARFSSNSQLLKHMKECHGNEATLCTLCLEHRPLFVSEQCVFTPQQLAAHMMLGSSSSSRTSASSAKKMTSSHSTAGGADDTGGSNAAVTAVAAGAAAVRHRRCEFCASYFFDAAALYQHMQREHFTCHLCPAHLMFRYYDTFVSLQSHFRQDHFGTAFVQVCVRREC